MTHIVFGINLSCCILKQILNNFCVATSSSTMQRSPTILYMVRVEIHIVHVNKMYTTNVQSKVMHDENLPLRITAHKCRCLLVVILTRSLFQSKSNTNANQKH